jgi:hypothetical protein
VVMLLPVPVAGLPPVAVQANVYGVVPPVPVAVNVTGVPTVPVVGPLIETASASGEIATVALALPVADAESVPMTEMVCEPLVEYVVLKLDPVPEAGLPPVAVHENVMGGVPPVAEAVQGTAVPTVPVEGQLIVTTSVCADTSTVVDLDAV